MLTIIKQILTLILYLLLGWILVHFMAVLGIFLVIAIPVLHLVFYPRIICFWCQLGHPNHSMKHSLIDSGLALFITILSIGLVYTESQVLHFFGFPAPKKTISFSMPAKGQYRLGEIFPFKIEVEGVSTPINVVQADLHYDPLALEIKAITTTNSFAKLFIQKDINNTLGYARITGGLPNPGFTSADKSLFATVYFRSKEPGLTEIKYLPSSLVLANNGKGSNLLKDLPSEGYLILPERISSEEYKLQENILIQDSANSDSLHTQLNFSSDTRNIALNLNARETGEVLGTSAIIKQPSRWQRFLEALGHFDQAVIELIQSLFGR